ncbi:unnamed protein product [Polarella glacialis]|uniref:Uncharacterized protein n=1 Tax=Polarella glacialis TaxID=89957 RepID=A0A813F7W6_POLGL|nr:unnamed protein product [Polarella glacialis]
MVLELRGLVLPRSNAWQNDIATILKNMEIWNEKTGQTNDNNNNDHRNDPDNDKTIILGACRAHCVELSCTSCNNNNSNSKHNSTNNCKDNTKVITKFSKM